MPVLCFPSKCTSDEVSFRMDFSRRLQGETILYSASSIICTEGCDVGPETMLCGPPVIDGARVSQQVIGGIPGNAYELAFEAETSGGRVLFSRGRFSVTV